MFIFNDIFYFSLQISWIFLLVKFKHATSTSHADIFFIFNHDRRREREEPRSLDSTMQQISAESPTKECSLPVQLSVVVKTHLRKASAANNVTISRTKLHPSGQR